MHSHTRKIIQESELTDVELAFKFAISVKTISKHKKINFISEKISKIFNSK